MKYSHNYSKLIFDTYTTIRRNKKGDQGNVVKETYPNGFHFARIAKIEKKCLSEVSERFLREDTDEFGRKEAYVLIQSFYKTPIDFNKEAFYIYYMEKCDEKYYLGEK